MKKSIGELTEDLKNYNYNRENILNVPVTLRDFPLKYGIENFYSGEKINQGDCVKLTESFVKNNLENNLIRVVGSDSTFFNKKGAVHVYALMTQKNLPRNFWELTFYEKKDVLENSNSLIFDPSFGKVLEFSNSGYKIDKIFESEIRNPFDLSILKRYNSLGTPLGFLRDGRLASLGIRNYNLAINFKDPISGEVDFEFLNNSSKLSKKLSKEKKILPVVKKLSKLLQF
jgi:hypothetical protein